MDKLKKSISSLICIILIICCVSGCSNDSGTINHTSGGVVETKNSIDDIYPGNEYLFGKYEQDGDLSNGKEDIKWIVLEKVNNSLLLMSEYGLEPKYFNETTETRVPVTWEGCTLRTWLNNDFYNEAFDSKEKKAIGLTTVVADDNPDFSNNPGNDTQDKVFILSNKECSKYLGNDRICYMTPYCETQKMNISGGTYDGTNACYWWLRVSGEPEVFPYHVDTRGKRSQSFTANAVACAVRPVIWVNID